MYLNYIIKVVVSRFYSYTNYTCTILVKKEKKKDLARLGSETKTNH